VYSLPIFYFQANALTSLLLKYHQVLAEIFCKKYISVFLQLGSYMHAQTYWLLTMSIAGTWTNYKEIGWTMIPKEIYNCIEKLHYFKAKKT
jgi:hypothetical protein